MALNIPMPKTFLQSLLDTKKQGVAEDLARAQTAQAYGSANKSNMLANLLNGSTGQGMGGVGEGGEGGAGATDINRQMLIGGLLGIHPQIVNGMMYTGVGAPVKVGETAAETRTGAAGKEASAATLKDVAASALGGASVNESIRSLRDILNNPNYEHIAGTAEGKLINSQPAGIPLGSWLQKTFPGKYTKEDAELAGQASGHMGNIITGVAAKFKGPFKAMVGGIINNMKPNMGDSIAIQKGKLDALQKLSDFADKINNSIENDINNGMTPAAATFKAVHEYSSSLNNIKTGRNNGNKDIITIIDSNNEEHQIHKNRLAEAKKIDPGLRVK